MYFYSNSWLIQAVTKYLVVVI